MPPDLFTTLATTAPVLSTRPAEHRNGAAIEVKPGNSTCSSTGMASSKLCAITLNATAPVTPSVFACAASSTFACHVSHRSNASRDSTAAIGQTPRAEQRIHRQRAARTERLLFLHL